MFYTDMSKILFVTLLTCRVDETSFDFGICCQLLPSPPLPLLSLAVLPEGKSLLFQQNKMGNQKRNHKGNHFSFQQNKRGNAV